ncbi:hypothetical protein ABB02_00596 [Clostridiaceae bacterium JG1575]|nr:hypothetical protein ABB02_00596 [Clostridiaceae bacterium JG1575]
METTQRVEQQTLRISSLSNLFLALIGLFVYWQTGMKALLLDASYTFLAVLSNLIAISIAKNSMRKDLRYPAGRFFLEPLYGILRSLVLLALLLGSSWTALLQTIRTLKGEVPQRLLFGPILLYELAMVVACYLLYRFLKRANESIQQTSVLLHTEAQSNRIDGLISLGIFATVLTLSLVPQKGVLAPLGTMGDAAITLLLVVFLVKEPLRLLRECFYELSGSNHLKRETLEKTQRIVKAYLPGANTMTNLGVKKVGKKYFINVHLDERQNEVVHPKELKESARAIERTWGRSGQVEVRFLI